jgi:predicted adenine nucleotide alpha hydrolase (AANH) superfamily ATPase
MKEKLVLHVCCAPDEAWVINQLAETRELWCFFCNPNIFPHNEYKKREDEARKVAEKYSVPFSAPVFEPSLWEKSIAGLEHTPEKGERCRQCFLLRLRQTASFCREINWPSFTSVMSISPHKDLIMLDMCGKTAAQEYGVKWENFNFKKQDGFLKSINLSKELGLYRQDYCGCRLSMAERDLRRKT